MNQTSYEKGAEEGLRELIQAQLEERFGLLTEPVQQRLRESSADRLNVLGRALIRAQSLRELRLEDEE